MTIDNLNCLLKKFTFLREHHPLDRSTAISITDQYIDISIVINVPRRSWTIPANDTLIGDDYNIFPVIKDVLSYFGLTHKNFYRLVINEMTQNAIKFTIYTSDFWNVGDAVYEESGHSQRIADLMEEDLPIPLSEEKINQAKEAAWKRVKYSFRDYNQSHITSDIINQYVDLRTTVEAARVEPISVAASASSNAALWDSN